MRYSFTLFFALVAVASFAQVTITSASFPVAGDTLKTLSDFSVGDIAPTAAGPDQTWDYSSLSSGLLNERLVLDASEGDNAEAFPTADLVVRAGGNFENYFAKDGQYLSDLGFFGGNAQTEFLTVAAKYTEPYVILNTPASYEDSEMYETSLLVPAAREDLPDSLIAQIPDAVVFDSIRIRVDIESDSEIDAWGTMMIPGAEYEVLRENRFEIRDTRVEIKISILPWVDATALLTELLPGLLGLDTVQIHNFYAEGVNVPVASLLMDGDGTPTQVSYKFEGIITSTSNLSGAKPDFVAYPNPAIDKISLSATNLPEGEYTVRIFNLLGQDAYKRQHYFKRGREIDINVAGLRRGSYFYSILDDRGKPYKTKRLVIIRP